MILLPIIIVWYIIHSMFHFSCACHNTHVTAGVHIQLHVSWRRPSLICLQWRPSAWTGYCLPALVTLDGKSCLQPLSTRQGHSLNSTVYHCCCCYHFVRTPLYTAVPHYYPWHWSPSTALFLPLDWPLIVDILTTSSPPIHFPYSPLSTSSF